MSKYLPIKYESLPEYTANEFEEFDITNHPKRIWEVWKYKEDDKYYRKSYLYISNTYNATNKTIEEFKEINNNIILKLVEPGKEPVFLCLYFNRIENDGSLSNIDMEWTKLDKIIFTKPLKQIQISGDTTKYFLCAVSKKVIWFDFEDGSTFYIEVNPKNRKQKRVSFKCNYKILDELSPLMLMYKKTYFSFWCCGKHFFL